MSEYDIVMAIANGLSMLVTSGHYPEDLRIQLQCFVEALSAFLQMYLSVPTRSEKRVYLRLVSHFIRARAAHFRNYPQVTRYLQFVQLVTTQYLDTPSALPAG